MCNPSKYMKRLLNGPEDVVASPIQTLWPFGVLNMNWGWDCCGLTRKKVAKSPQAAVTCFRSQSTLGELKVLWKLSKCLPMAIDTCMGVSINRGTPIAGWLGKSHWDRWFRGALILGNNHIATLGNCAFGKAWKKYHVIGKYMMKYEVDHNPFPPKYLTPSSPSPNNRHLREGISRDHSKPIVHHGPRLRGNCKRRGKGQPRGFFREWRFCPAETVWNRCGRRVQSPVGWWLYMIILANEVGIMIIQERGIPFFTNQDSME